MLNHTFSRNKNISFQIYIQEIKSEHSIRLNRLCVIGSFWIRNAKVYESVYGTKTVSLLLHHLSLPPLSG